MSGVKSSGISNRELKDRVDYVLYIFDHSQHLK